MKARLYSCLTTTAIAVGGAILSPEPAQAIIISFSEQLGNAYRYDITLEQNEVLYNVDTSGGTADTLLFSNLVGVTGAETDPNSPYTVSFVDPGGSFVEFSVRTTTPSDPNTASYPITFEDTVTLFSTASSGAVDYTAEFRVNTFFGTFPDTAIGQVTGPAVAATAIPFEFSPAAGSLLLLMLFGSKQGWKLWQQQRSQ